MQIPVPPQTGTPKTLSLLRFSAANPVNQSAPTAAPASADSLSFSAPPPPKKIDDDIYNLIRGIPKVTLHDHFAGSADLAIGKMELLREGQRLGLDAETLRERFRVARSIEYQKTIGKTDLMDDENIVDLPGLKKHAKKYDEDSSLAKMKQLENVYMAAYLYTLKAARENVRYFEIRSNPFPKNGTAEEMVQFIQQGIEDARTELGKSRQKIDYGIILLGYRHGDNTINEETGRKKKVDKAIEVAKQAIELKEKGYPICGVDLAGDEQDHAVSDFAPYFDIIKDYNNRMMAENRAKDRLGITVHAGETTKYGSGDLSAQQSIEEAIRLAWDKNTPIRIGHGIAAQDSPTLIDTIKDKGIGLEMCPKSNVQTEAVGWYPNHPAATMSRQGVKVSISPDNQTVSNTDSTNEFVKLHKYVKAGHEDRKRMVLSGLETAFIFDPQKKKELIQETKATFAKLERKPKMALARFKEEKQFGNNPRLTFEVYDGLKEKLRTQQAENGQAADMREELSKLVGAPISTLDYLPFQVREWLQTLTTRLSEALVRLSDWLKTSRG